MPEDPKIAWVTKWATTKGIIPCRVLATDGHGGVSVEWLGGANDRAYFCIYEWHPTREAAIARAEEMRTAEVAILDRKIEKLKKLNF